MDAGSFTDPNAVFVRNAARIFQNTTLDFLFILIRFFPGLHYVLSWLRIDTNRPRQTRFFRDIVRQAIRQRRESGQRRNDLIDLMIDAIKEEDKTTANEDNDHEEDQYEQDMRLHTDGSRKTVVKLDEDIVVATAMVILVAGYDTTGMTLSYLAYFQPRIRGCSSSCSRSWMRPLMLLEVNCLITLSFRYIIATKQTLTKIQSACMPCCTEPALPGVRRPGDPADPAPSWPPAACLHKGTR